MTERVSELEEQVTQLRQMLHTSSATARAVDQNMPWELIAMRAIDDGYVERADEFVQFVRPCLRHRSAQSGRCDCAS